MIDVFTVSEITSHIKSLIDDDEILQGVWLKGEISNYTLHSSGHQYFTLKDEGATIKCVKFKFYGYAPETGKFKTGDTVLVHGSLDLYPPQGTYQLKVTQIHKQGLGDLYQQFAILKDRLLHEGLFDASHKKEIPQFPRVIGVVSSPTGAVIQDIQTTITRRYPLVEVRLSPARMQGEKAADDIIHALKKLDTMSDVDTILIARGGGSMEDLWCFNDEKLVRFIYAMKKPVISAIGHETDLTLCDFVADMRAPTPTAAAELSVPDQQELLFRLQAMRGHFQKTMQQYFGYYAETLDRFKSDISASMKSNLEKKQHRLEMLQLTLAHAHPLMPLQKGFTLTTRNGVRINSSKELQPGETIETRFADGTLKSTIQ